MRKITLKKTGAIRIIGGKWRGRKLSVPVIADLRPTPDRVRETIFNWLTSVIVGARCLDLFAGSGALGFEALSRGAKLVVMIDQATEVIALLQAEKKVLQAENLIIKQMKLPQVEQKCSEVFDIVFIDPPYDDLQILPLCCQLLEEKKLVTDNAYIYLESREPIKQTQLPSSWRIIKSKRAGQVCYQLAIRNETLKALHA